MYSDNPIFMAFSVHCSDPRLRTPEPKWVCKLCCVRNERTRITCKFCCAPAPGDTGGVDDDDVTVVEGNNAFTTVTTPVLQFVDDYGAHSFVIATRIITVSTRHPSDFVFIIVIYAISLVCEQFVVIFVFFARIIRCASKLI